jgi:hypothetical protein
MQVDAHSGTNAEVASWLRLPLSTMNTTVKKQLPVTRARNLCSLLWSLYVDTKHTTTQVLTFNELHSVISLKTELYHTQPLL